MNKQKSIFEIKECIDAVCGADCAYFDIDGFAIANEIYKANYRKASEVAEEIFAEIEKLKHTKWDWNDYVDWDAIAKLKKKYTEGEE